MNVRVTLTATLALFGAWLQGATARAEEGAPPVTSTPPPAPPVPGFVCHGEGRSVEAGASLKVLREERDKRLSAISAGEVPSERLAHYHCVVAEIMVSLGDLRAADHFELAIALHPKEPAYELFYARYLAGRRGAGGSLVEASERHYQRALQKLEEHEGVGQAGSTNAVAYDWTRRGLYNLYAADGLPLLPWQWKAYPYDKDAIHKPQLFLGATFGLATDTNDFWELSDTRKFTSELLVYRDRTAGDPNVSTAEREAVARDLPRAPLRFEGSGRVRLRQNFLGALDATFKRARLVDSQVTNLGDSGEKNDVDLQEIGGNYRRSFNLEVLDFTLDAGITSQVRRGVIEFQPDTLENLTIFQVSPVVSRFIGPDKLTLGGSYVYFHTPDLRAGPVDERSRQRVLRAAFIDYAIYRPLVLPQLSQGTWQGKRKRYRGWHWFAGATRDDERFGQIVIEKTDVTGGSAFKGLGAYDVTLTGTYYESRTEISAENAAGTAFERQVDESQSQSQFRSSLVLLRRIVDQEIVPGMPGFLQSLTVSLPLRHDTALSGPREYENFRAGLDVWALLFARPLRASSLLLDAGVAYQNFYNVDRQVFMAHVNLRLGWPHFGNNPAY